MRKGYVVSARHRLLCLGERTWIMGIINVSTDSFYPGSRATGGAAAAEMAGRMLQEGVDILDVGGESTRPGANPICEREEIGRVVPVVEAIRKVSDIPLSVDTYKSAVAQAALEAGADIVNDISGFHADAEMAATVARFGAAAVVMHLRGTPETMQMLPPSADIFADAEAYLLDSLGKASTAGLAHDKIIVDPGIGFGKTLKDNLRILRNLELFRKLDRPILVGPSRKSFIGKISGEDVDQRLWGTAATLTCAVLAGAHIVRVHDVAPMKSVAKMADALAQTDNE